ncbi:hypothetical protein ACP26F_14420 [Franconibacter pulveris 1160]|nr:hypothetical protein [Franconibacter pulveris]
MNSNLIEYLKLADGVLGIIVFIISVSILHVFSEAGILMLWAK